MAFEASAGFWEEFSSDAALSIYVQAVLYGSMGTFSCAESENHKCGSLAFKVAFGGLDPLNP